jgi:hypothetical protein
MVTSKANRRRYPRIQADAARKVGWVDTPQSEESEFAEVIDLGIGGIRFRSVDLNLEIGDVVEVTFTLDEHPATVVGKVIRLSDEGSGTQEIALAFLQIDPATVGRLHAIAGGEDTLD